ncbi:MAG TPA: hypothetical protein VES88_00950 [Gemmatimonadaceae bacterium]|nr:hypothetical protein [Gemmatimonadaceae bacterium]
MATLLGIDEREDDRPVVEGYLPQAHLTVRSGQSFWARNVQVLDGMVTGLDAQNARFAIDQSIVKRINPVEDEAVEVDWAHQARVVELRSGISLNAHMCFRRDDRIEVRLFPVMQLEFGGEPGKTLVLDPELAKNC